MRCGSRVGSGLNLCWAGLLLKDWVVAKTLALAFLAVSADGMGFVTLGGGVVSACVKRGQVRVNVRR